MKRYIDKSIFGAIAILFVLGGIIIFGVALSRSLSNTAYSQGDAPAGEGVMIDSEVSEDPADNDTDVESDPKLGEEDAVLSDEEHDAESEEVPPEESEELPTEEQPKASEDPVVDVSNESIAPENIPGPRQYPPDHIGDFYFASFDIRTEGNVKAQVSGFMLRFLGTIDFIDPALLTDVVLTKDGVPIESSITLSDKKEQYQFNYKDITDFFFVFTENIIEPGIYGLTGKYNGEWFKVYNKIIENPINDTPADPAELRGVGWVIHSGIDERPIKINELVFSFNGRQNTFYPDDLTELIITRNGEAISFSFMDYVFRYLEYYEWTGTGNTSFNLVLNQAFTESGTYTATGLYRGTPFSTMEMTIP